MAEELFDESRVHHIEDARLAYLKLLQIIENNVYDTQYYTNGQLLYPAEKIHEIAECIVSNIRSKYGEYVISRLKENGLTIEKGGGSVQDHAEQAIRKLERQAYISMARYALSKILKADVIIKVALAEDTKALIQAAELSGNGHELDPGGSLENGAYVESQMAKLLAAMRIGDHRTRRSADDTVANVKEILLVALGIHRTGIGGRVA